MNAFAPTPPRLAKLEPPPGGFSLPRPRLFERLRAASAQRAVWVAGEPGAGKSTLVSDCIRAHGAQALWYRMDPGESDPQTLLDDLTLGFKLHYSSDLESLPLEPGIGLELQATQFFKALFARVPQGAALVFDAVERAARSLIPILRAAVTTAPPGMCVLFLSRGLPPREIASLQFTGKLSLIEAEALHFTVGETAELLSSHGVAPQHAQALHALTEGWAACTDHAARLLGEGQCQTDHLPDAVAPALRFLASEVLDQLAPEDRRFLVLCALLPEVSPGDAAQLTDMPVSLPLLERLCHDHLFVYRLAGVARRYRLHPLMRLCLLTLGREEIAPAEFEGKLEQACLLLLDQGRSEDAIELLTLVDRPERLSTLLIDLAPRLLDQGMAAPLVAAILHLPAAQRHAEPALNYWLGAARLRAGDDGGLDDLEVAYSSLCEPRHEALRLLACASAIRHLAARRADYRRMSELWGERLRAVSASALASMRPGQSLLVMHAHACLSMQGGLWRNRARAIDEIETLLAHVSAHRRRIDPELRADLGALLLEYCECAGLFPLFERLTEIFGDSLAEPRLSVLTRGRWLVQLGRCLRRFEDAEPLQAIAAWAEADRLAQAHPETGLGFIVALARAEQALEQRRLPEIKQAMEALRKQVKLDDPTHVVAYYSMQAEALLRQQRPSEALQAVQWANACAESNGVPVPLQRLLLRTHAVALITAGAQGEALTLLENAQRGEKGCDTCPDAGLLELVRALEAIRTGQCPQLPLARGMRIVAQARAFPFAGLPELAARLCRDALANGYEREHALAWIARRDLQPPSGTGASWPWRLKARVLGGMELEVQGAPLSFGPKAPRKPLELLQAIIACGPNGLDSRQAMDWLWPRTGGSSSRDSFDTTVHRLRKLLPSPDALIVADGRLTLDARQVWSDVSAFNAVCLEVSAVVLPQESQSVLERLGHDLLDLYRGPFLAHDETSSWAIQVRQRLQERFQRAVVAVGAELERRALWHEALALYARGLEQDNVAEDLYRGEMRCYLALDEPSAASRSFRRCRELLSIVLGVAPATATITLRDQIYQRTATNEG